MDNIRITENKKPMTQIVHGSDKVVDSLVQIMQKAQRINICVDNTRPSLAKEFKQIRDAFIDAKSRGVTIRYITEITENNVSYCKELMPVVELRHLDDIKGNFYVTEHTTRLIVMISLSRHFPLVPNVLPLFSI